MISPTPAVGPPDHVLDLFAVPGPAVRLPGGQGRSVLAGDLVLSPGRDARVTGWLSPVLARLAVRIDERPHRSRRDLRVAVPVPARDGSWVVDGWAASRYEPGTAACDDLDVVVAAARVLHAELAVAVPERPEVVDDRDDRWARADSLAFEGADGDVARAVAGDPREDLVRRLVGAREAVPLGPSQLVHGDLAGNVLLDPAGAPVVIDLAPYWRPAAWAEAVAVLDAVLWWGRTPPPCVRGRPAPTASCWCAPPCSGCSRTSRATSPRTSGCWPGARRHRSLSRAAGSRHAAPASRQVEHVFGSVVHRSAAAGPHRPQVTGRRGRLSEGPPSVLLETTTDIRPRPATTKVETMPAPQDREKALDTALAQIDRQFGKGSIMRLGDEVRVPIAVIPTGSIALDVALGIGGLPRGRVVEIYGPESSGKTTVALHAVANAQKAGGIAAFIDAEHALDPEYAEKLGVDTDALLVSQPDTGEQALEIADMLIRSGALDIIVIDSVAALVPRAEIEGEMGDSHVGLQARLMSQALRKLTGALSNSGTTAIFINQLREKIGVMFGSPETTTGGKALKFYASVRLDVRRIETLKDGTDPVGNRTRVKVVKNKVSPPFKQAEFDILYGQGISREGGLIDMGVEQGFVRKSGAWYTYDGDQLGQGKENARAFMRDNPDLADELEKKIKEKLGIGPVLDAPAEPEVPVEF